MRWLCALFAAAVASPVVSAQESATIKRTLPEAPVLWESNGASPFACSERGPSNRFAGNHNFDCFIGFMSVPLFNIDPRAVTELYPLTGYMHSSSSRALPDADIWLPPVAGLTVALSERLSVGICQGGYAIADFSRNAPGTFLDRDGRLRNRADFSGQREGWLNIAGFAQYTFYEDVPGQALATAGLRWTAPVGSQAIFQGIGPVRLAPYLTVGKAFGNVHVLATAGYEFPTGSGGTDTDLFYGCLHIDRQFDWLYPLVEFNWIYHRTGIVDDLPTRGGFVDLSGFSGQGNLVTVAVGANAVLIRNKLELGAVYSTPIASTHGFDFNSVLVKMVIRF
ncbi:MAG: hypothetical protein U0793_01650 [Gemmataceae bacterium]